MHKVNKAYFNFNRMFYFIHTVSQKKSTTLSTVNWISINRF